jgi:hypothetical protein
VGSIPGITIWEIENFYPNQVPYAVSLQTHFHFLVFFLHLAGGWVKKTILNLSPFLSLTGNTVTGYRTLECCMERISVGGTSIFFS